MGHDNEGITRLVTGMRKEAEKVTNVKMRLNMLGVVTNNGIYVDAIEDEIPRSEFMFLKTQLTSTGEHAACVPVKLKKGDRVVCIPVGEYYVVLGKVE